MARLAISIVNFNTGNYLFECLSSIKGMMDEAEINIYVVDNASSDNSIELAKKVGLKNIEFILNKENVGFARGHNIAFKKMDEEYVLILNPDTLLQKGAISAVLKFMVKNPDVGAATCKVVFQDGKIDLTAHRGFPTPLASLLYFLGNDSAYHLTKADLNTTHEVDAISGSYFFTRMDVLKKVGFFDQDYFMYAEDIDLCYKIKKAGLKIMYISSVSIIHHKGVSSGVKKHSQSISTANFETKVRSLNAFYGTMKVFYRKHYESAYPFFINWLVYLGINIRWWLAKRNLTVEL